MKKVILVLAIIGMIFGAVTFAEDASTYVSIGLTYENPAYNTGQISMSDAYLFNGSRQLDLKTDQIVFSKENGYRIQFGENLEAESDFDSLRQEVNQISNDYEIGFGSSYTCFSRKFSERSEAEAYMDTLSATFSMAVVHFNEIIRLTGSERPVLLLDSSVMLKNEQEMFTYDDRQYHGYVGFHFYEGNISIINRVAIDDYLYGVVPREMEIHWPMEALKAQAVVARTYLLKNLGRFSHLGFDLVDTASAQAYGGIGFEKAVTNEAVDLTESEIVTKDNVLINTYYHGSSGGLTASSENVWSTPISYLRSIQDPFSLNAPNANWSLNYTESELIDVLATRAINVSAVSDLRVSEISVDQRVQKLTFDTDKGTYDFIKEDVRRLFGYNTLKSIYYSVTYGSRYSIMSAQGIQTAGISNMSILNVNGQHTLPESSSVVMKSSTEALPVTLSSDFSIQGKGWGHGVGLSQWGAKTMAEQGFDYQSIIAFYYQGATVVKR
jgi:stage II sporulation protein D